MVFSIRPTLLIICIFLSSALYSQNPQGERNSIKSPFYKTLFYTQNKVADTIFLAEEITSLSLSIDVDDNFGNTILIYGEDTTIIREDLHEPVTQSGKFSQLIIFEKPVASFVFIRDQIKGDVHFHLINSGTTPKIDNRNKRLYQECGKPNTIDQSEWRAGLPVPNYTPSYSKINHIIVHHTAGSNTNMDFTNVVRQIYLYHTEVRNYSDIGYNFLIAQDGTIYKGREGAGDNEENVIGAHFCAKNTNTMGISLLGDYETANPTNSMLNALEYLMAWKLSKENLDPFESDSHPVGSASASPLGVISGHRDGCATLCPGNNVYSIIDLIKQNTDDAKKNFDTGIPFPQIVSNERQGIGGVTLEVNGGVEGSYLWFTSENIFDSIPEAKNSIYVTPFLHETTTFYAALKMGSCIGPLLKIDAFIRDDRFLVFPNPADGIVTVTFNESFIPSYISILNSIGQRLDNFETKVVDNKLTLDTSILSNGVYFLILKSADMTINKKLIVE